jgi:hypothetical protein
LWSAFALLFLALGALFFGGSREPGPTLLILCIAAAVLGALGAVLLVWAIGYQRLAYTLTDSALRIDWLGRTVIVPYPAIQGIYTGQRLEGHATPNMPQWPGISVGNTRVRGLGRLRFYATSTDQSALTFITVEHGGVIVSAQDPMAFRAALIERVEHYAEPADVAIVQHAPPTRPPWTALADPWLPIWAALGLLLLLLIVAVIVLRFDALPDQIALHFDAVGRPSQIASRSDLLRLPMLGLVCLALNWAIGIWVHPRERLLARLLWLGGAVIQLIVLIGVVRLVA